MTDLILISVVVSLFSFFIGDIHWDILNSPWVENQCNMTL